jgi:RNA polymerase-binding transcription factor DksA
MKNADVLDQAQEITDFMREAQLQRVREHAKPEQHPNFDGRHCVEEDCEAEIPDERLALGRIRCVDCAARLEKEARGPGVIW